MYETYLNATVLEAVDSRLYTGLASLIVMKSQPVG